MDPRESLETAFNEIFSELPIELIEHLSPEINHLDKAIISVQKKLCQKLDHKPIQNHCGKPEHDFCRWCGETTPNQVATNQISKGP